MKRIEKFSEMQKIPYLPAAAVAAMIVVAWLGYVWLPRAEVMLPLVGNCRLDREVCSATLPDGGRVELALEPRPVPKAAPMRVILMVRGAQPAQAAIEFRGVEMNMGVHRLPLAAGGDGRFSADTTLPVCVTGRMLWQASVDLEFGRRVMTIPFRFESGD